MRACPACGGYNPKKTGEEWISKSVECIYRQEFVLPDGCPLDKAYDLLWCKLCGIAYADVKPDGFTQYYRDFDIYKHIDGGNRPWDDAERLFTRYGVGKACLDFGCGGGELANVMSKDGEDVAAYDGTVDFNTFCFNALQRLERIGPEGGFDVVTMMHVLEHCYDPALELRKVRSVLSKTGEIYLEVPDSQRYEDDVLQEFNCEHINHFTVHGIDKLLDRADLELLYIERGRMTTDARGKAYPVIRAAAKPCVANRRGMRVDWSGLPYHDYLDYFNRGYSRLDRIQKQIRAMGQFNIWGCGQLTWKLLNCCKPSQVLSLFDGNPAIVGRTFSFPGDVWDAREVHSLENIEFVTDPILACSPFGGIEKEAAKRGIQVVSLAK